MMRRFKYVVVGMLLCVVQVQYPMTKTKEKTEMTYAQNAVVGSLAGATEVLTAGQPLSYATNRFVQKLPLSSKPAEWYTGMKMNLVGMVLATSLQQAAHHKGKELLQTAQGQELSNAQKMGVAAGAGAVASLAVTPSEAVPVYMQKPGNESMTTTQAVRELRMRSWRGLLPTATRDAKFATGYLALNPLLCSYAAQLTPDPKASQVAGGVASGVVTAVATQPSAVVKTALQADPFKKKYATSFDVVRDVYAKDGLRGFFHGLTARGSRVMVAVPLLNTASEFYKKKLTNDLNEK